MKIVINKVLVSSVIFLILLLTGYFLRKNLNNLSKYNFLNHPVNVSICEECNVLLIVIDTLRADHLGVYGYPKKTSPFVDEFSGSSFIFTNNISVAPWTLPSMMSILTGMYPQDHRITNKYLLVEDKEEISNLKTHSPQVVTISEILKENGIRTAAFTGGAGVDSQFGFEAGFDKYFDDINFGGFDDTIPLAIEWLKENNNEQFFLMLHGYDVHGQYISEKGYDYRFLDFEYNGELDGSKEEQKELREEGITRGKIFLSNQDVRFLISLYDEKISKADERLRNFFIEFEKLGVSENTIVIITSDHGEEFYEHGRIDHGHSLYEELVRVPLLIKFPGQYQGSRIDQQVGSIDIMPTILEILGINIDKNIQNKISGKSLFSVMSGTKDERSYFLETDYRYSIFLRGLRTFDSWKIIMNTESSEKEIFDINNDESETKDLSNSNGSEKLDLIFKLFSHFNLEAY